jgi:hypothetical protein
MRRSERIALDETARLHPNDWSSIEVRVLDVSAEGFRAECEARVIVGCAVTVEVPGIGPVEGRVSWRRAGEMGARFLAPIDLERCGWRPAPRERVLARLLVQRAAARRRGAFAEEQKLRQQILSTLPIRGA